tara:strand:- start:2506 stop:2835 length:330 start_codon:yes stop_codon:yes gene_type:complete
MRLYKSSKGEWVGTQRDAQRNFPRDWTEVDVPTSKMKLIDWLNSHEVGASRERAVGQEIVTSAPHPDKLNPEADSWVQWAYETLRRGDKKEAEAMLIKGLNHQKELSRG